MHRIVTQVRKRAEALKKTRKIRISVTTREVFIGAAGTQPAGECVTRDGNSAICPFCHRDIVDAVNQALDRMETAGVEPEIPAANHIDPHRNTQSNKL